MSEDKIFTARVQALNRIAIPQIVAETLEIKRHDIVEVKIRKIEGRKIDDKSTQA